MKIQDINGLPWHPADGSYRKTVAPGVTLWLFDQPAAMPSDSEPHLLFVLNGRGRIVTSQGTAVAGTGVTLSLSGHDPTRLEPVLGDPLFLLRIGRPSLSLEESAVKESAPAGEIADLPQAPPAVPEARPHPKPPSPGVVATATKDASAGPVPDSQHPPAPPARRNFSLPRPLGSPVLSHPRPEASGGPPLGNSMEGTPAGGPTDPETTLTETAPPQAAPPPLFHPATPLWWKR